MKYDPEAEVRRAAERRLSAALAERHAIAEMNKQVRHAREAGVSAAMIAEWLGTTRQRVYEILREG